MNRTLFEFDGDVKQPAIVAVKRALEGLIVEAEEAGDHDLAALRRERYENLSYTDIEIENLHQYANGRILVSIIVRFRGWLRYDLEIGVADMFDILSEYEVPVKMVNDMQELQALIADKSQIEGSLVYRTWDKRFGCIVNTEQDCDEIHGLLGYIRFSRIKRNREPYHPIDFNSGTVDVEDMSVGSESMYLYVRSEYSPLPPDPEDMTLYREPMYEGQTELKFTLNKEYPEYVWEANITAPDFDIGELVVAPDKKSATMMLTLKRHSHYTGHRKITGTVVVTGETWDVDLGFQHNPVSFSSASGSNDINDILNCRLSGNASTTGYKAYGPVTATFTGETTGKKITWESEVIRFNVSGKSIYIYTTCPVVDEAGTARYQVLIDGAEPDTSNYADSYAGVGMHFPEGATRMIAEPISLTKGETEYDFIGKVKVYWDDPKKTPVENPRYGDLVVTVDPKHKNAQTIYANKEGYDLHFFRLEQAPIEEMTVLTKIYGYDYIGYPSTWVEHRYGYTGPGGLEVTWGHMAYYKIPGVVKQIDANGATLPTVFTKVGFQEGIWYQADDPKLIKEGVGSSIALEMHIARLNRNNKALSVLSLTDGTTQHDIEEVFEYIPVDLGEVSWVHDPDKRSNHFTITLPEGGINAKDLIVESRYDYGDTGSIMGGSVYNRADDGDRKVTFTVNSGWGDGGYTYYRLWFSNAKERCSVYRLAGQFFHETGEFITEK